MKAKPPILTKREYMATKIFAAIIVLPSKDVPDIGRTVAAVAVGLADKLIDALNQPRKRKK